MEKTNISLSIVIPVYNEEKRLSTTFNAINDFLKTSPFDNVEIIFVNDGSHDKTDKLITEFNPGVPVRLLGYSNNQGKGHAVTVGMLAATLDYHLMLDADMSTPITEITNFLPNLEKGERVLIGNRRIKGSVLVRAQPVYRRLMGRCYTLLANLITGVPVSDFTCGFKVFSREASKKIFSVTRIKRWSYDTEILFLAHQYGYKIIEIPVTWTNDVNTRVNLFKDTVRSFTDLLRIRFGSHQ